MLGYPEIILILAVVLLVFGPSKLPEMARALGSAMKEFRKAASELEEQAKILENPVTLPPLESLDQKLESALSVTGSTPPEEEANEIDMADVAEKSENELAEIAGMLNISSDGKTKDQLRDEVLERVKALGKEAEEV